MSLTVARKVEVGYRDPHPRRLVDPANGERVTRCRSCGMPNRSVIIGTWEGAPCRYPVCSDCVMPFLVRDPLSAA